MIKLEEETKHKNFYLVIGIVFIAGLVGVFIFRYYLLRAVVPIDEAEFSASVNLKDDLSLDSKSLSGLNDLQITPLEKATTTPGNTNPFIVQ